jgi:hypothetical protein
MAKKKPNNNFNWNSGKSAKAPVTNTELNIFKNPNQYNVVDTEKRIFNNPQQRTSSPYKPTYKSGPHWFNWGTQGKSGGSYAGGIRDYAVSAGWITDDAGKTGGGGGGGGSNDWGGGGGGGGEAAPVTWEAFDSQVAGAPAWWKALKPSEMNEATEYLASLNMMIPFLSLEDQRSVAANLYQQNPEAFGHLNPETIDSLDTQLKKTAPIPPFVPPSQMTTDLRKQFTSAQRYTNALTALTQLASAVGKSDAELGPGYRYLRSILNTGQTFGAQPGAQGQTRRNYLNQMGALDPLLSQTQQQSLSPYSSIARMLSQPYFTAGQLVPVQRAQDGRYLFGEANKELL